jgi:ADP-heptose:LPS heptosyltransferase/predicted SAM-dependent methyltransferase
MWSLETSKGNESAKIRWRIAHYCRGSGLDIGCGPFRVFPMAVGIDGQNYSGAGQGPNMVMRCEKLPLFATGAFDYAYSSHLLEHIEDTEAALREWLRVVRVGGYLILHLPHKDLYPNIGQPGANPDHKHDFIPTDITKVMRKIGGSTLLVDEVRGEDDEYSFVQVYRKETGKDFANAVKPRAPKTAAIVRPGNFGDALWASTVAHALKREGYHVTAYVESGGEEVLRHDPNIDEFLIIDKSVVPTSMYGTMWLAEEKRYDRWINLVESVEVRLLLFPSQVPFGWPAAVRREHCDKNYLEEVHKIAGLPYELQQRFHPTTEERAWARAQRHLMPGPIVVMAPTGSTWPKFWPWADALAVRLAQEQVHVVIVGDTRGEMRFDESPWIHVREPKDSPIRKSMALAIEADAVVGEETGMLNAVAIEANRKVVLLSHSSKTQLTRDWTNTIALAGAVPCQPCHQVHLEGKTCTKGPSGKYAACQEAITVDQVIEALNLPALKAAHSRKAA